jgi:hypothetical protein
MLLLEDRFWSKAVSIEGCATVELEPHVVGA